MSTLGRKNCEYVVGACGWVKLFLCVLVNSMTHKDCSRGGQWCSVCFYRLCTTLPSCCSMGKPTMIVVAVQGPPQLPILHIVVPCLIMTCHYPQILLLECFCQSWRDTMAQEDHAQRQEQAQGSSWAEFCHYAGGCEKHYEGHTSQIWP